jgi:predicted CopG family antitoxin
LLTHTLNTCKENEKKSFSSIILKIKYAKKRGLKNMGLKEI